jgi:hypothetical protein
MKPVRQILLGLSLALVGLISVPLAKADGIVVTDTTIGSGVLDGTVFAHAWYQLTGLGRVEPASKFSGYQPFRSLLVYCPVVNWR